MTRLTTDGFRCAFRSFCEQRGLTSFSEGSLHIHASNKRGDKLGAKVAADGSVDVSGIGSAALLEELRSELAGVIVSDETFTEFRTNDHWH